MTVAGKKISTDITVAAVLSELGGKEQRTAHVSAFDWLWMEFGITPQGIAARQDDASLASALTPKWKPRTATKRLRWQLNKCYWSDSNKRFHPITFTRWTGEINPVDLGSILA